jgi:hypothetical protein
MTAILLAAAHLIADTHSDRESFKTVSMVSCCGLAVSIGLLALGIDLPVAWL